MAGRWWRGVESRPKAAGEGAGQIYLLPGVTIPEPQDQTRHGCLPRQPNPTRHRPSKRCWRPAAAAVAAEAALRNALAPGLSAAGEELRACAARGGRLGAVTSGLSRAIVVAWTGGRNDRSVDTQAQVPRYLRINFARNARNARKRPRLPSSSPSSSRHGRDARRSLLPRRDGLHHACRLHRRLQPFLAGRP